MNKFVKGSLLFAGRFIFGGLDHYQGCSVLAAFPKSNG